MRQRLLMLLMALLSVASASAFNFEISVTRASHVVITTKGGEGRVLSLKDGWNSVDLTMEDSPLQVAPSPTGKIVNILYGVDLITNINGPVNLEIVEGSAMDILTKEVGVIRLIFSGMPEYFTASIGGQALNVSGFNDVASGAEVTVAPAAGCKVTNVRTEPEMPVTDNGDGTWTFTTADKNMTVTVSAVREGQDQVTVRVDDPGSVTLTTANGRTLDLQGSQSTLKIDFNKENPLTVKPTGDVVLRRVLVDTNEQTIGADGSCTFTVSPGSVVDILTSAGEDEEGWTLIVDEDFAGLTQGTPDAPDMDSPLLDEFGNFRNPSVLRPYHVSCTKGWGGDRAYPAGGALAVMGGFIQTPVGDYSGDLKMTFRARLVPGKNAHKTEGVDLILLRASELTEYKRATVSVTEEWQTFTFEAVNGWYHDTRIQFFSIADLYYEIDDVRILHRVNSIEPPKADWATETTNNSFTANWQPTATAEQYLLSVYEKGEKPASQAFEESFEGASVDAAGHVQGMPQGWEYNLDANGDRTELNTDPAYASTGSNSVCLDANMDYLVTPTSDNPLAAITYRVASDGSENPAGYVSQGWLNVAALTDGGWTSWLSHPLHYLNINPGFSTVDATENLETFDHVYAVRFEVSMSEGDRTRVFIDDVKLEVELPAEKIFLWEDHVVEGQQSSSCTVTDPQFRPEADYYYYVKARNSEYTSEPSAEIEVFYAHTPEALEATDVTEDGFTANWDCGSKASQFEVQLYRTYVAQTYEPEAVILEEDFSKVETGATPEDADEGAYTTVAEPIDLYTHLPGWRATSWQMAEGAIGGMAQEEGYQVGSIRTPVMDLSNDGGTVRVQVRAWLQAGEALQVQGVSNVSYGVVQWPQTGWGDAEFTLPMCSERDNITFWTGMGTPFFLDHVKIIQALNAGDRVDLLDNARIANDPKARSLRLDGIVRHGNYEYSYDVLTRRFYNYNVEDAYSSDRSNRVAVMLPAVSVEQIEGTDGDVRILGQNGGVLIETPQPVKVGVYTTDGTLVLSQGIGAGRTRLDLPRGIYMVTAGQARAKALIH